MSSFALIAITGPDGSGKSMLVNAVREKLKDSTIVSIWDAIQDPTKQGLVPFRNLDEVDTYLSHLHHESRSLILMHCLVEAMEMAKKRNASYILADGYWYKYFATEKAHGASEEYLIKLVSVFDKPALVFHIDAEPGLTFGRKQKFTRYECGFANELTEQSFVKFQKLAIANLKELMSGIASCKLDATRSVAGNCEIILRGIAERQRFI